ncbi:MAG: pyridoxamine 5'-phosphate oxidase family protein [Euzebyaceae bacterium]|jgi:nitroimidazol reductase NimA-like FMN-containing flavoprotein (pyridoxamine 5'-phosphate oxidase superfamily)|nr:pyridoxamine 5'-phosphate oxidase family protein [Euzebyaceae bacterium]
MRRGERARHDRDHVLAILDEGLFCHLGVVVDTYPMVVPTAYGRDGGRVYVHGSTASRVLRAAASAAEVCLTVTLVDGLVLARSVFHHSVNYRSVMVYGPARPVTAADEKAAALRVVTEHLVPGRWEAARPPTPKELAATSVLAIALDEASAKVRTGAPVDDEADYDLDVWAGVIPLALAAGAAVGDPRLRPGLDPPDHVRSYQPAARR